MTKRFKFCKKFLICNKYLLFGIIIFIIGGVSHIAMPDPQIPPVPSPRIQILNQPAVVTPAPSLQNYIEFGAMFAGGFFTLYAIVKKAAENSMQPIKSQVMSSDNTSTLLWQNIEEIKKSIQKIEETVGRDQDREMILQRDVNERFGRLEKRIDFLKDSK